MTKQDEDYIATGGRCLTRKTDVLSLLQATSTSEKLYRLDLSVFIHAFETALLAI